MRVRDRSFVVTGGASGLGLACVQRLVAAGARVVLLDLPGPVGPQVAESLGGAAVFVPCEVTDADQVTVGLDAAQDLGEFRGVVHCAGIAMAGRIVDRAGEPADQAAFDRVIAVNLSGTFNVLRLAAARLARQPDDDGERGVVVLTSSAAGFEGQTGQAGYSAAKAGVIGLTLTAARDLAAHHVRVCAIAPGTFDTPMLAGLPEKTRAGLAEDIPHPHRLGRPSEFALLARHIIENPYLNGEVIRLDGALRLPPR